MSESSPSESNDGHVHFESSNTGHDALIDVEILSETSIAVNLGFLKQHHIYEICFKLPDHLSTEVSTIDNIHTKVKSVKPSSSGKGHDIIVEMDAFKERLMHETVTLRQVDDHTKFVNITFSARVLGKGKGTPSIRRGIHCIGTDPDYDSEASDWPGFTGSDQA